MKNLKLLLKLADDKVKEEKKQISELEAHRDMMIEMLEQLKEDLITQQNFILRNPEMGISYENYSKMNLLRREKTTSHIAMIEENILRKKEILFELFQEYKRYEIAIDNHAKRIKEAELKNENKLFDEIASRKNNIYE